MTGLDYWKERLSCAADECGLKLTEAQITCLAEGAQGGHENYGMAFHQPASPYPAEIRRLESALASERAKVVCKECRGEGRLRYSAGPWGVDTGCHVCRGEGKVAA